MAPQRGLCRCQIEPHRVPAAVEPFDSARAGAGLDDAGIRVPPGEIEPSPARPMTSPGRPSASRSIPSRRVPGTRGLRLRNVMRVSPLATRDAPRPPPTKGAQRAERAHSQAWEILHTPARIPDSEDRSTDTDCSRSGARKLA